MIWCIRNAHSQPLHQCQKQSVQDHVVNLLLWLEEVPILIQKNQELVHQMILCTKNAISTNASIAEAECIRSFYEFTSLVNTYPLIQKNQKMGQQDQMWIFFFWLEERSPPHSEELETSSANDLVKWKCTLNHRSKGNSRMYKIMLSIFCFGLKKDLLLIQKNQKIVQQMILWSESRPPNWWQKQNVHKIALCASENSWV